LDQLVGCLRDRVDVVHAPDVGDRERPLDLAARDGPRFHLQHLRIDRRVGDPVEPVLIDAGVHVRRGREVGLARADREMFGVGENPVQEPGRRVGGGA